MSEPVGLFEVVTRTVKPASRAELEGRAAGPLEARQRHSPLGAWWYTELGPLNQQIQVWPYRDHAHRAEVRAAVEREGAWPPDDSELAVAEQVELCTPAPFGRALEPGEHGPIFEMRTYTFRPGTMPNVLRTWAPLVEERDRRSPLVAAWFTEVGVLHRFTHVWGYPSLDERARIRQAAVDAGIWPPLTREWRLAEESKILVAAAFSPVR